MNNRRKILPEDIMDFQFVENPSVSPKGNSILFTVTRAKDAKTYGTQIWCYSSNTFLLLEEEDGFCSNLCWNADGSNFAYTTTLRGKEGNSSSQVWLSEPRSGRKRLALEIPKGKVQCLKWTPDSNSLLFISDYDDGSALKSDVKVISRLQYRRDGEGFFEGRRPHIFKTTIGTGNLIRLTGGNFDVSFFDIAPHGKEIVFVSNLNEAADIEVNQNLFLLSEEGGIQKLTDWSGPIDSLSFSPDGQNIAFVGHDYKFRYNTAHNVHIFHLKEHTNENASGTLDRTTINCINTDVVLGSDVQPPIWSEDSRAILFLATDQGKCNIYSVDVTSLDLDMITKGNHIVNAFSLGGVRIAYTKMDSVHLPELYAIDGLEKQSEKKLTKFNDSLLSQLELISPLRFVFKARDGVDVEGWFYRPDTSSSNSLPCVIEIHGGGSTEGYEFMHEFQCLTSSGFAVLTCNFRGTQGYDRDFVSAINDHYMEKDYEDIIDMVKFAVEKKWVDPQRLGVAGGSYGGWLTSWLVSHEPNRFMAAIADRSVVSLNSFYGTSEDYRTFEHTILGYPPWQKPSIYSEKSVLTYAQKITTPMLILHSEEDYICPISEAEQLFAYLKRGGKEVLFVRFPHEGHGLSRYGMPRHRVERLGFYLWWFTSHVKTGYSYHQPL